jgi:FAD/FMN-containing dehydrogenase
MALPRRSATASNTITPVFKRFGSTLPPRSEAFAKATKEHVEHIKSLLSSPNGVMSTLDGSATTDDLQPFNDDWMNKYHGKSQIVVKPKTTQEVSEILKYCNEQGLAVVPQGGNTGLVGM